MKPDEIKPVEMQEGANNPGEIVSLLLKKGLLTKQKAMYAMRVKSKLSRIKP
jgi:hypothetical protein